MPHPARQQNRLSFPLSIGVSVIATAIMFVCLFCASQAGAHVVKIQFAGSGTGVVGGSLEGESPQPIDCGNESSPAGPSCEHDFSLSLAPIELEAIPSTGFEFLGWTGVPSRESGTCATGMASPCTMTNYSGTTITITATFGVALHAPEVQIESVAGTDIRPTAATFHGSVNPRGGELSSCRFEYLTEAEYESSGDKFTGASHAPCDLTPEEIGEAEGLVDVKATAGELEPSTAYRVRLVAEKEPLPPVTAEASPFTTGGLAPLIALAEGIANPTLGGLYAEIVPQNEATAYRFEWGPTPAYGHVTPSGAIPAGSGGVTVVAPIDGLTPQTTYHFNVVAENGTGVTDSGDRTFVTPAQPPIRGLELVSSAFKDGADAMAPPINANRQSFLNSGLVAAGRAAWTDRGVAPNPLPTNGILNWYSSARDAGSGWSVRTYSPSDAAGSTEYQVRAASPDLETAAVFSRAFDFATGFWGPATLLYRDMDGSLSTIAEGITEPETTLRAIQVSADDRHVVLHSSHHLLAADAHEEGANQVYEWSKADGLSLVGVDSKGNQLSPCGALLAGLGGSHGGVSYPDVSPDGSRVLIQSPDPSMGSAPGPCRHGGASGAEYVSDLYLREGSKTTNISRPAAGTPDYGAAEIGATPDLSEIFFVTESALPDDDPATPEKTTGGPGHADIYRYETATGRLTRLSVARPGGEEVAAVSPIAGALANAGIASADGSTVYFTAKGRLIPGMGATLAENARTANLYRWHRGGGLSFVATVAAAGFSPPLNRLVAAVNPDGSALVFQSSTRLTAYDNQRNVIYRYDAATGKIACVSCSPIGTPLYGSGNDVVFHTSFGLGAARENGGAFLSQLGGLSADGATVVFASADRLLPGARNVSSDDRLPVYNVYAWHEGALQLISTGTSPSTDMLLGTSPNGDDIYFVTAQRLLPGRDPDEGYDIYDARVGGGFPEPAAARSCAGQECRGGAAAAPAAPLAASDAFLGAGNLKPRVAARRCGKGKVRQGKRCVSKRERARRICRKKVGRAKRRCVRRQMRRLSHTRPRVSHRNRVRRGHRRGARRLGGGAR